MRFMRPFYRQQAVQYLFDEDNNTTPARLSPYPIGWVVMGALGVLILVLMGHV
jgi:hypothetical protein